MTCSPCPASVCRPETSTHYQAILTQTLQPQADATVLATPGFSLLAIAFLGQDESLLHRGASLAPSPGVEEGTMSSLVSQRGRAGQMIHKQVSLQRSLC